MGTIKIRVLETACFLQHRSDYLQMDRDQFLDIFLPFPDMSFIFSDVSSDADICICSHELSDHRLLREDEINIFISIENLTKWPWYEHYNRYGEYGNPNIDLYIYNHIDKVYHDPQNNILALPLVHFRIHYFQRIQPLYTDRMVFPFDEKKFMLVTNRSMLNTHVGILCKMFSNLGTVDHIGQYDDELNGSSCYNSIELLRVFNRYKFILTIENSYTPGYITEKIFNVFLARSIPVY